MKAKRSGAKLFDVRPTAFLIVFYILFLLTQPCQDVLGAPRSSGGEANASRTADDEDCNGGGENCSPFCICSCRQAPAGYFLFESAAEPKAIISPTPKPDIAYTRRVPVAALDSIWQPPKH